MKRLIVVLCVAGLFAALPLSHLVAARPAPKVEICHIIAANDVIPFGPAPVMLYFGKEISVAADAVDAHIDHGDSVSFWGGNVAAGPIATFKAAGFKLPAADCYYGVTPSGIILP